MVQERSVSRPFASAGILFVGLMLPAVFPTAQLWGQGIFRQVNNRQSGRLIAPPRRVQQQLREAERALEDGRNSDAVVRLGDLLSVELDGSGNLDLAGQDFFMDVDDSRGDGVPVTKSLMRTARAMIANLPSDARKTYELRYGPLARKLLIESAATRDWNGVREVRRRYFHTKAGYEASILLATNELFGGHPLSASLLLDEVVSTPQAVAHLGPSVVWMHAAACIQGGRGMPEITMPQNREIRLGDQTLSIPGEGELADWISKHFRTLETYSGSTLTEYPVFGAEPDRNGGSAGQMPLMNLRWKLGTTASPRQERAVRKAEGEMATSGKLPPPSWVPLKVGDQLLMRTTERLVGVDYRTGKRVWTYPWQTTLEWFDEDESSFDTVPIEPTGLSDLLSQRVWNDVPYGRITSDGQRVFVLDDLRQVEITTLSGMMMRGTRPADAGSNTLVALDLATEGKLLWRLGSEADGESNLSDAFFLGPPLPLDGRLYVMFELAGDINLCCLDPATGNEFWRQQLVAVESVGIDGDPIRRVAGATPTFHEGILICPTGAGAVVALNLADRTLRWSITFNRMSDRIRNVRGRRGLDVSQLMHRWYSGAAIASGTSVLVTPIESDRLFGCNLLTGEKLFAGIPRDYMRYLAGIRDGKFLVAGANQVEAYALDGGRVVWTTPEDMLAAGQHIAGVGVFGENEYFVPTTSNQIVAISLQDGSVTGRRDTRYPLGNLVAADGEIIAQSATALLVAFGEATLEPLVNRMLEENPNDFDALVRKSELLIQHDDRQAALDLLARAREMQPDNDEVRMLSVTAMLGSLRESSEIDPKLVDTLDGLIDRPSQRAELLALRIRSSLADQEYVVAASKLIELSSLVVQEPLLESAADQIVADPSRQCSLDAWLSARVGEISAAASEEDLQQINALVRDAVAAKQQGSNALLTRIVRHFGALDGVESMRVELATRLHNDGSYLALERLALGTAVPSQRGFGSLSNSRLMILADAYVESGMLKDAAAVLDVLDSRDVSELPQLSERISELREASQEAEYAWSDKISLNWNSQPIRMRATMRQRVATTTVTGGKTFRGWNLVSETARPLALRDPYGLMRPVPHQGRDIGEDDKEAQVSGAAMVVVMPNGLIALDMNHVLDGDGESILWQRSLSGDAGPGAKRRSRPTPFNDNVYRYVIDSRDVVNPPEFRLGPILGDRLIMLQGGDLMAIDLLTKETLWRNSSAPKSGFVVSDGDRVAVITSRPTPSVSFFNILDGRKLDSSQWEHGDVWASSSSHVLCYSPRDSNGKHTISVVDPFSNDVLLEQKTVAAKNSNDNQDVPRAFGRVVEGRYMALLNNDGEAIVWDILEGRELANHQLPAYPDLQGLNAIMLNDQLILLPKQSVRRRSVADEPQLQTTDPSAHETTHGIHAISLDDGTLRWGQQFDEPWGCTLTQPAATPILMLSRGESTFKTTGSRRKTIDVLAIDVRDGSEFDRTEKKPVLSANNELATRLTVQPGLSRVIVQMGTELLTYTFGAPPNNR